MKTTPLRILIVDDNLMNLKLLRAQLEGEGHSVVQALNGVEALEVLAREKVEAIFSDILMPVMDGYRLCYEVRRDPRFQDLPFITYTASYVSASDEKLSRDLGADQYLRKPATTEQLAQAISSALASPGHRPVMAADVTDVLKEYSERLVDKLEEQNTQLMLAADRMRLQAKALEAAADARKIAGEQLFDAHTQLRQLLDHSPAVLYALKIEGEIITPLLVSENVTRLLGFNVPETLDLSWWRRQVHPDDREAAEASISNTLQHGVASEQYRLRHKDGSYRWLEDNCRLVLDAAGGPQMVGVWSDITERRRVEDELRESERRFQDMHSNLQLISLMLDRDARVTYCNDYFLKLTGWERQEVIGRNWLEMFIPPEDIVELRTAFASLLNNSPNIWHRTSEILTRSGERKIIQWNNSVLRSTSGEVTGSASIGEDITSRVLAERELRRSEEQLQIIMRASNDGIGEWNLETDEVYWSDRAFAMLGRTRESFTPTFENCRALVHPDDVDTYRDEYAQKLDLGESCQVRIRVRHADGSYVPILGRLQLQRETGRLLGAFTDLSIVERSEEQIRDQAALIDQAHDAIIVRDLDDRITSWSKGAERLYGWAACDALGRRFDLLLRIDTLEFKSAKKAALADGGWSGEVEKMTANGRAVIVDSSWTLLRDDHGQPKSMFSIDTNITDRKSLEKQFFRAQRLESLGTLAGGIAHDLNNLLMPILMGVTLLKRLSPGERSLQALNNIERSVKRGTDLVKQVMLFARGGEGTRTAVDARKIMTEVEAIAGSTFPKNITLVTTIPERLANISADATQLNQVLLNLCVNARDAMPGGGQITISAEDTEIENQYAVMHGGAGGGRYVVLEVSDDGNGIPAEVMDRIFEPFFTTKEVGKGTGLGLSTVQGIVRSYGGFVKVMSELGTGSTFQVYLPALSEVSQASSVELELEELPRGGGELILVVDDEASILGITKQTLEEFGYSVLTAEDGAHAIGIYAREHARIALVITDMMMPVIDGAALIPALRRINPNVLIIAVSGHVEGTQMARTGKAEATQFLAKPHTAEAMLRALSTVLRSTQGRAVELIGQGAM